MKRSVIDEREYYNWVMKNELEVLYIQDDNSEISQVSLAVNIGSFNEEDEINGLAHFLEHMLFMGSKTYPGESQFPDFINSNCGNEDAYTDLSITNYQFEIRNAAFLEGFKMLSRFFIDPLFNQKSVDKEIKAVDSEFRNLLRDEIERKEEIKNKESNLFSPFRKFSTGNFQYLKKPGLLEALREFYDKNYSADIMNVVVYTSINLDIVEEKIDKILNEIPNKNLFYSECRNYIKDSIFPFDNKNHGMLYKIEGVRDNDKIYFR